jgi:uncharacterized protein YjdB
MILTDTQQVTCSLDPRNSKGNPATLDGVPVWSTSDEAIATVEAAADGLTALVKAVTVGTAQISVVADADLDVGEQREITGLLDIEVKAGEAVTLGITAGTPEEQTDLPTEPPLGPGTQASRQQKGRR